MDLLQHHTEAMTVGGVIGIFVVVVAWLVNDSPFPAIIQSFWVVLAYGTSIVIGLVFGLWLADKVARRDPVGALRCE